MYVCLRNTATLSSSRRLLSHFSVFRPHRQLCVSLRKSAGTIKILNTKANQISKHACIFYFKRRTLHACRTPMSLHPVPFFPANPVSEIRAYTGTQKKDSSGFEKPIIVIHMSEGFLQDSWVCPFRIIGAAREYTLSPGTVLYPPGAKSFIPPHLTPTACLAAASRSNWSRFSGISGFRFRVFPVGSG